MFRAPSGPAPRKRTFHQGRANPHDCDITNVILPHGLPPQAIISRCRQSSRSPATRRVYTSMFRALQWRGATQTYLSSRPRTSAWHCDMHERNFATRSAHTLQAIIPHDTANHPAHHRHAAFTPACFALPRHANTLSTKAAQVRKALRHHGRNSPHGLPTH